jgi:uncharacterized protein
MTVHHHRWAMLGLATSGGLLGLTVTSGLAVLANKFVEEFTQPHVLLDNSIFVWKVPPPLNEPGPDLQRSLLFAASDGTLLSGEFWAQTQAAPTIILCHGYRASRSHLRSVATLNYACGYNVLLFDFRGHGDSDSVMTSGGNAEIRDVQAAIEVARLQPESRAGQIILYGFSMGAAVALMVPWHPDVAAIIADSPYARSEDILYQMVSSRLEEESAARLPSWHPLPQMYSALAWSTLQASRILFRVRFGYGFVAHPAANFKRWRRKEGRQKSRILASHLAQLARGWKRKSESVQVVEQREIPILLVHAKQDPLIPFSHAQAIAAAAEANQVPVESYFVECDVHCGAFGNNPVEYCDVFLKFLKRVLGDAIPEKHGEINIEHLAKLLSPGELLSQ